MSSCLSDTRRFCSYEEGMRYLRKQAELHPDIVTLTKVDVTEEGRDLMLVEISRNSKTERAADCKAIWIDSGLETFTYKFAAL